MLGSVHIFQEADLRPGTLGTHLLHQIHHLPMSYSLYRRLLLTAKQQVVRQLIEAISLY